MNSTVHLVDTARTCRLLEPGQLAELAVLAARFPDPRVLAGELIRRGWLTPFQVNQIFQGRGPGLMLGSYVLLERLGEGGMGAVFKARNWKLGTVVALKVIRKERLQNPDVVRRFQREIQAAAHLSHPNIVRAYDADEVGGTHFFVMEYVEGTDLARLVKERGPLPVREACEYVRQAALGLQHAFERGLVHRDVKPHNLLLTTASGGQPSAPTIKILDLGLARLKGGQEDDAVSALTQEGAVMGTPDYIAPEQAWDSHGADIRADLYSLGCTLYFLLRGRAPFSGGTLMQKLARHQREEPPPLEEVRPDIPSAVAVVVRRLIAKQPDDRYQTPAEAAAALAAVLETPNRPAAVAMPCLPPSVFADLDAEETSQVADTGKHAPPTSPPRRLLVWAGGALGLCAVILLAAWLLRRGPESPEEEARGKPDPPKEAAPETPDTAFNRLRREFQQGRADPDWLWHEILTLRQGNLQNTRLAIQSAALLKQLPSPLDRLRRKAIPESERFPWQPEGLVAVLGEHRSRHWAEVICIAWSPKKDRAASGGNDQVIRVWDTRTMRELAALQGHTSRVMAVAFSRDGSRLFSSSDDGTVIVWNVATGKEVRRFPGEAGCFSADGRRALSRSEKIIQLYDVEKGEKRFALQGHTGVVECVAFSADGRWGVSGGRDATVRLWDLRDPKVGKEQACWRGHEGTVNSVLFSPDGRWVVSGGIDHTIRLWNVEGRQVPQCLTRLNVVRQVVFSPDGRRLLCASEDNFLRIWDVKPNGQVDAATERQLKGHAYRLRSVAFSPDSRRAISGGDDGTLRQWDVASVKELDPLRGHPSHLLGVALSPDGRLALSCSDGEHVARVWGVRAAKELRLLKGHEGRVTGIAFSPDGRQALTGSVDGTVRLWDVASGKELRCLRGHQAVIFSVAFSSDGRQALSGGGDYTSKGGKLFPFDCHVYLWDLKSGKKVRVFQGPVQPVRSVAFSPDGGRVLAASGGSNGPADNTVWLWDRQGNAPPRCFRGHTYWVMSVAFSPDGSSILSGSYDRTIRLWDLDNDVPPLILQGHTAAISGVAFAPDGRTLVSTDYHGRVIIWNRSGDRLGEWKLPGPVYAHVSFAVDGKHVITGNANGTVYILRLPAPPPQSRK